MSAVTAYVVTPEEVIKQKYVGEGNHKKGKTRYTLLWNLSFLLYLYSSSFSDAYERLTQLYGCSYTGAPNSRRRIVYR